MTRNKHSSPAFFIWVPGWFPLRAKYPGRPCGGRDHRPVDPVRALTKSKGLGTDSRLNLALVEGAPELFATNQRVD